MGAGRNVSKQIPEVTEDLGPAKRLSGSGHISFTRQFDSRTLGRLTAAGKLVAAPASGVSVGVLACFSSISHGDLCRNMHGSDGEREQSILHD